MSQESDIRSLLGREAAEELRHLSAHLPHRIEIDSVSVEQGLARLVLTILEFVRRLLEKQAVRRLEGGNLDPEQVEDLGLALMKLEEKMEELKDQLGLAGEELNWNITGRVENWEDL